MLVYRKKFSRWATGRASFGLVIVTTLALAACTSAGAAARTEALENVDAANGHLALMREEGNVATRPAASDAGPERDGSAKVKGMITLIHEDMLAVRGKGDQEVAVLVTEHTRFDLANVEDDDAGSLAGLTAGMHVEIKYDPENQHALEIELDGRDGRRGRKAEIEGVITEVSGDEVTIESRAGRRQTVVVGERTRLEFDDDDDFRGRLEHLRAGMEVEAKFNTMTSIASKIEIDDDDEDRDERRDRRDRRGDGDDDDD